MPPAHARGSEIRLIDKPQSAIIEEVKLRIMDVKTTENRTLDSVAAVELKGISHDNGKPLQALILPWGLTHLLLVTENTGAAYEDEIRNVKKLQSFPDARDHPYEDEIRRIALRGVMKGIQEGKNLLFRPDQIITRSHAMTAIKNWVPEFSFELARPLDHLKAAEGMKLLLSARGIKPPEQKGEFWYVPYLQYFSEANIIDPPFLQPDQLLTRADFAMLLSRLQDTIDRPYLKGYAKKLSLDELPFELESHHDRSVFIRMIDHGEQYLFFRPSRSRPKLDLLITATSPEWTSEQDQYLGENRSRVFSGPSTVSRFKVRNQDLVVVSDAGLSFLWHTGVDRVKVSRSGMGIDLSHPKQLYGLEVKRKTKDSLPKDFTRIMTLGKRTWKQSERSTKNITTSTFVSDEFEVIAYQSVYSREDFLPKVMRVLRTLK